MKVLFAMLLQLSEIKVKVFPEISQAYGKCSREGTDSTLQWRYNGRDSVTNHQPHDCLLNRLFRCRSKKTSKLRVTGLCAGNSPVISEFPAQMASNPEKISIWGRHHEMQQYPNPRDLGPLLLKRIILNPSMDR